MAPQAKSSNFIDTVDSLTTLVSEISQLPQSPIPSLYIDLEGIHLSRQGSISLMSLFIAPLNQAYLIDIHTLGATAFSTPSSSDEPTTKTLKTILEDPDIPKVFFDVRNDSDALFSHFSISLHGIVDLQLMELGSRPGAISYKRLVSGLARCIRQDSGMSYSDKAQWEAVKERGLRLYAPEKGGSYQVFNARPLKEELRLYCVQDVTFLPKLWEVYNARLAGTSSLWRDRIEVETKERVRDSQSATYLPNGRHKALGPWNYRGL